MDLFLVNCTKQHQVINLRHPESDKLVPHHIGVGKQKPVLTNASKDEISTILDQLRHFKPINVSEVDSYEGITTLAYSMKPSASDKIAELIETNGNRLDERASEIQTEAALAANQMVEEKLMEAGAKVQNTELNIEEIIPVGSSKKASKKGVKVDRSAKRQ